MTNYYLLILGYLFILISIIFFVYRLRKVNLTEKDYEVLVKFEKFIQFVQIKALDFLQISKNEVLYMLTSLKEKFLRRIKIEALKIETWANKKLEKMKEKQNNNDDL